MKIIRKRNFAVKLFLMLFALSSFHVIAQRAPAEFSIHAAGGVSTYCFQPRPQSSSSLGYSSDFGVGFSGFLSQQVGIHVGIGFGLFDAKSKISNLKTVSTSSEFTELDDNGRLWHYNLHTTLSNYTEIHKSLFLNIPVMFQFQTQQKQYWSWKQSPKPCFYAMGGVKVIFLFNNQYEASVKTFSNIAEFYELGPSAGTQKFKELGTFDGSNNSGKMDFGVMAMFALELGVKWRIANNICIYTGAFFDCALNDPIKDNRKPYENYISQDALEDFTLLKTSDRANLMVVGVKLRFAFSKRQRGY